MALEPNSTLYLLRHAHAAVALPGQRDHERPLDERGQRGARQIGQAVADKLAGIDAVLCSTSVRTRQTLDALRPHLREGTAIRFCESLYEAATEAYLAEVRECRAHRAVLVIGHNPTIEELALQLAGKGDKRSMALLREGMPTTALAVLSFGTKLAAIGPGSGFLELLLRPRDLAS